MASPTRCRALAAVALLLGLTPAIAHAQAPTAASEFKRGKDLMAKGKLAEACAAFDESQRLAPNVSTVLNQANCREKNSQLATAHQLFTQAAIETDRSSDVNTVQLHTVALDRAAKLGPRVSTITLDVSAAARVPGLSIKRDGNAVTSSWSAPIELDGGTYAFEVSAPGYQTWTSSVTLAPEKDQKTLTIPALAATTPPVDTTKPPTDTTKPPVDTTKPPVDTTKPPVDTTKPTSNAAEILEPPPPPPPAKRSHTVAYAVIGGGLALGLTGLGFHLWASSTYYDHAVLEGDDDKQTRLWHDANNRHYIAVVTGATGLAAIGVGIWLLLRPSGAGYAVTPAVSDDTASLVISGAL